METSTIIAHFYVPGMLSIMTSAVSIDEAMSPMIAQRFRRGKQKVQSICLLPLFVSMSLKK